jgi:arabinan endo-1,5-alpha-L-arabinosidase
MPRGWGSHRGRLCASILAVCGVTMLLRVSAAGAYPLPLTVTGDTLITDPAMAIRPSVPRYVVYGTHDRSLLSNDRVAFSWGGLIFPVTPSWWAPYSSGDMWAPDVSFHNGQYWMYYAVSKLGSRFSAIGLATSPTGLPGNWTDQGPVASSDSTKPYNAIDPNLMVDAGGNWWLTFGSYWGGIYIVSIDPSTGKLNAANPTPANIAQRPGVAGDPIEGGFVYQHNGAYYLFASYDYCCEGSLSTYKIKVGRATSPTGPYVDESGTSLLNNGGTLILAGHDYVAGPGGESVYYDTADNHDVLVYHYYDTRSDGQAFLGFNEYGDVRFDGQAFLGINFLGWDANDFPYVQ